MRTATNGRGTQVWLGLGEYAVAGVLVVLAGGVSLTALMRLFDPVHWGFWVSPTILGFGVVDNPNQAREILGNGIHGLAVLSLLLCSLAGHRLVLSARRRLAGSQPHRQA